MYLLSSQGPLQPNLIKSGASAQREQARVVCGWTAPLVMIFCIARLGVQYNSHGSGYLAQKQKSSMGSQRVNPTAVRVVHLDSP